MSKLRGWFAVLSCMFVLLLSLPGFTENGGTLYFVQSSTGEEDFRWPVSQLLSSKANYASMVLDRGKSESVSIFFGPGPVEYKVCIASSEPARLFVDLNGDEVCQPDEIHLPETSNFYQKTYKNVTVPTLIGGATTIVACDLSYTDISTTQNLLMTGIRSYFEGTIELNGQSWSARLILPLAITSQVTSDSIIILDTNRDGHFDLLKDTCIATQGLAQIDGKWWQCSTRFEGVRVEVVLAPYQGPMGKLEIKGESVYWIEMLASEETSSSTHIVSQTKNFIAYEPVLSSIYLKMNGSSDFSLPAGEYRIRRVVLREGDLYLQSDLAATWQPITVREGETTSLQAGGPLHVKVIASPPAFSRVFSLDFKGCNNDRGIAYQPLTDDLARDGVTIARPEYEVLDSKGKVIKTGHFDYG